MSALKYAKRILSEVIAYQDAKRRLAGLLYNIKDYEGRVEHTRSERRKAVYSAHLSKLHNKAAIYKQKLELNERKIKSNIHKLQAELGI